MYMSPDGNIIINESQLLQVKLFKQFFVVFANLAGFFSMRLFYAAHFYRRHCQCDLITVWIGDRAHKSVYKSLFAGVVIFKMSQLADNDIGSFQFWKNIICVQLREAAFKVADAVFTVLRVKGSLLGAVSWIVDDFLGAHCLTEWSPVTFVFINNFVL